MSSMFGAGKRTGKTVALVDIESGATAATLTRLSHNDAPKLFGEKRIHIPVRNVRDTNSLIESATRATQKALEHISSVAARVRSHSAVGEQGEVSEAIIFVSTPFAAMHLRGGTADYVEPVQIGALNSVRSVFGDIPTKFYPQGTALLHGTQFLYSVDGATIICIVGAEVSELLVLSDRALLARATVPTGSHMLLRTLISHIGMSIPEAESYLSLPHKLGNNYHEPLVVAENDFARRIEEAMREFAPLKPTSILVFARENVAELLARALTRHEGLARAFPNGGTVRAARASHVMPFIAAHSKNPDTHLMLEALFVDAKHSA